MIKQRRLRENERLGSVSKIYIQHIKVAMYTNKFHPFRRILCWILVRFPDLAKLKRHLLFFRVKSLRRRLESKRQSLQAARKAGEPHPIFEEIEIETFNRCNGECAFCPVNRRVDPRKLVKMPESLFQSLIDQLRESGFKGKVRLYSNNEPLLDARLGDFARYARESLPKADLCLSTNGSLLTPDSYREFIDLFDFFTLNNYCDDFKLTPENLEIRKIALTNPDWWRKTDLVMRYRKEVKTSRGGQAPNKRAALPNPLPVGCYLPLKQMVVRPDGKLSLCCNDALGVVTLGDLTKDSLIDAWRGPVYAAARDQLLIGRNAFPICRRCDTLIH